MTSAAQHLPPESSVSTSLRLLRLGGLEPIAFGAAGDIIAFPVPGERGSEGERGLLLHTPTFPARPGAAALETVSFLYSSLPFFFLFPKDGEERW